MGREKYLKTQVLKNSNGVVYLPVLQITPYFLEKKRGYRE